VGEADDEFDDVLDSSVNLFNQKIGASAPIIKISTLIEDVMFLLKKQNQEYLSIFKSFNNLEKIAIYFILMINQSRSIDQIFNMINTHYPDLSKRDILIKLLSEVAIDEDNDEIDPMNGLFKILNLMPIHETKTINDFKMDSDNKIEFKDFTFPMHSYNVTKQFG